jgi:hypothetical protein
MHRDGLAAPKATFPLMLGAAAAFVSASPASSQHLPEWSGGIGYLMSRPNDLA